MIPDVLGGHAPASLQRQAFSSIFINNTQPFETSTFIGAIEDEVPCPYVVLAARGPEMAGILVLPMSPAQLGIGPRSGRFRPRLAIESAHGLLVDDPALAIQQGPDPPVTEARVRPGQFLDASSQRRLFIAEDRRVAEAGTGQVQRPGHATLRHVELIA